MINITPRPEIILRAIELDSEKTNDEILLAIYENELEKNDKFLEHLFSTLDLDRRRLIVEEIKQKLANLEYPMVDLKISDANVEAIGPSRDTVSFHNWLYVMDKELFQKKVQVMKIVYRKNIMRKEKIKLIDDFLKGGRIKFETLDRCLM